MSDAALTRLLRRDRAVVIAALAVATMLAWAYVLWLADDMRMGGMDISHRGGRPGFVGISGDTLTIPDFHGNGYFNTFGNLLLDPRAALLFVDWTDGGLLHLRGQVEILWNQDGGLAGAERLWRISIADGWRRHGVVPLRWSFQTYAPQTLRTGVWAD